MTFHYAKCKGIVRTKENARAHKGPAGNWGNKKSNASVYWFTIGCQKQHQDPEDQEEGDLLRTLREAQQRENWTLKNKDLKWLRVNQKSSLGPLCGKPGGGWAGDDITGMGFRKVSWQQARPWKWDWGWGAGRHAQFPRTFSSYSYFTKSNMLGRDSESTKEVINWLVERFSYLVTQGGTTKTFEIYHSLKLLLPNCP